MVVMMLLMTLMKKRCSWVVNKYITIGDVVQCGGGGGGGGGCGCGCGCGCCCWLLCRASLMHANVRDDPPERPNE